MNSNDQLIKFALGKNDFQVLDIIIVYHLRQ